MKLIDILARELKEWKSNADGAVFSSKGGACYFFHGNRPAHDDHCWRATEGCFWFLGEKDKITFDADTPEDYATAIVTRAQWQAAVDALNKPDAVGWDGVGLPPPGTDCEFLVLSGGDSPWVEGEILYSSPYTVVISGNGFEHVHHPHTLKFRPIRTPEQIAAEEIEEVAASIGIAGDSIRLLAKALTKAGYRKQEQP